MNKTKIIKEKSVSEQLRYIRDKLSMEIKDMTNEQLKAYLLKQKTLFPTIGAKWMPAFEITNPESINLEEPKEEKSAKPTGKPTQIKLDFDWGEEFINDKKTINAVIRSLEIIGEAAKNIPDLLRNKYQTVTWKNMTGMRDKLIHEYSGVDLEIIWKTLKEDIPKFKTLLEPLKKELAK